MGATDKVYMKLTCAGTDTKACDATTPIYFGATQTAYSNAGVSTTIDKTGTVATSYVALNTALDTPAGVSCCAATSDAKWTAAWTTSST